MNWTIENNKSGHDDYHAMLMFVYNVLGIFCSLNYIFRNIIRKPLFLLYVALFSYLAACDWLMTISNITHIIWVEWIPWILGFEPKYHVTGSCDEKTEAQNLEIQCDFRGKCRNLFLTVARILPCVWASEMNQIKCLLINDIFLGFIYKTRKWQKRQKLSKILWWCVKGREFYRKIQKDRQYAD